ncbi:MAG: hypothetical protein ACR2LI_16785 [Propionibacteriaceae bacterium]
MTRRWLIVAITALAFGVTPVAIANRPIGDVATNGDVGAVELASRVAGSAGVPWSGFVQSSGSLQVPDADTFTTLSQLLGEDTDLRVWWRRANDWRVARIRSTGETDLFRQRGFSIRWIFESESATISPASSVRLPDESDFLPPKLARSLLDGATAAELTRLPARRVAGVDAPGLRLVPAAAGSTIARVDLWVDPATGLALRVAVYGVGEDRPVLTTTVQDLDRSEPTAVTTDFDPAESTEVRYDESVDLAAAANAHAPDNLPATVAGFSSRTAADPGAVGVYGHGPTRILVLPLRGQVAGTLRERLRASAAVEETSAGTLAATGPLGLLLTRRTQARGAFLIAGTVDADTLRRVADDLAGVS